MSALSKFRMENAFYCPTPGVLLILYCGGNYGVEFSPFLEMFLENCSVCLFHFHIQSNFSFFLILQDTKAVTLVKEQCNLILRDRHRTSG